MPIELGDNAGNIPHNCLVKLQAVYDTLKTAEKKAADLLLKQPAFFASVSIVEAAQKAGCSQATLYRLACKLGYKGFPELKADLSEMKAEDRALLYKGINEADQPSQVVSTIFQASIQALRDTLNILDKSEYLKAVDAICNAKKIVFCGAGDAAAVALSAYQKFIRIGLNVQTSADLDIQLINVAHLNKGDVLIVISHTGKTKSILEVVKYARNTGATIISITNYPIAPLAKNSDIILLTAAFTKHVKGEVMSKRVAELCIIESLFVNVLLKNRTQLEGNLERSNRALEANKS